MKTAETGPNFLASGPLSDISTSCEQDLNAIRKDGRHMKQLSCTRVIRNPMFTEIFQGLGGSDFLSGKDGSASSSANGDTIHWNSQNQYRKLGR